MFTGIIEHLGFVKSLECGAEGGRLTVRAAGIAPFLGVSNSIAVNGCCLTVAALNDDTFSADLSGETLRRTSFGELKPDAIVNLERPLTAGKEFGGHFVQGHVDGIGRVVHLRPEGENVWVAVRVPDAIGRYIAVKGSIAVDGVSLTVAAWRDGIAEMAIIPFTYAHTNLRNRTTGDAVNLECDILAKYVERLLDARHEPAATRVSMERLIREGF